MKRAILIVVGVVVGGALIAAAVYIIQTLIMIKTIF